MCHCGVLVVLLSCVVRQCTEACWVCDMGVLCHACCISCLWEGVCCVVSCVCHLCCACAVAQLCCVVVCCGVWDV